MNWWLIFRCSFFTRLLEQKYWKYEFRHNNPKSIAFSKRAYPRWNSYKMTSPTGRTLKIYQTIYLYSLYNYVNLLPTLSNLDKRIPTYLIFFKLVRIFSQFQLLFNEFILSTNHINMPYYHRSSHILLSPPHHPSPTI